MSIAFIHTDWASRDVYNTAGHLILTSSSSKQDLITALLALKAQLARLDGVPQGDRRRIVQDVDRTVAALRMPSPPRYQITIRLQRIKQRLSALEGSGGALPLANVVGDIAAWVVTTL